MQALFARMLIARRKWLVVISVGIVVTSSLIRLRLGQIGATQICQSAYTSNGLVRLINAKHLNIK